ncbi:ATP phosphoribosyltransferase regulatory subunit [Lichenihabitans psoromatis]|uniref:ATP phosphoribosyltransferase regulatory subunit n=1 Tax=Lichenihabitans psoromatis TaxID=2528642 RepID=UPI0010355E7F|nr:ATP phosphoribosyltransferase regulatory subunit [Lichenihabitans psoromatis]
MSSEQTAVSIGDRRQAALLARFAASGYEPIDLPILGPASVFIDFSGEEIRSGLFLTSDDAGAELCLRPEYTIPLCRAYLGSDRAGRQASFAYCGPVFRSRPGHAAESVQSGIESYGRADIAAADAEILALSLEAAAAAGTAGLAIRVGDAGLVSRVFQALRLPESWQRRLRRGLDKGQTIDTIMNGAPSAIGDHSGVLAALTGTDQKGARALVEDLLSIAGIASVGGRSAAEIAERFLVQVANKASPAFADEQRHSLDRFLAIDGSLDDASAKLRAWARETGLDLGDALDLFDDRINFMAACDIDMDALVFEASFGRNLDYYTGFVFEARRPGAVQEGDDVLIGGGRYDRLAEQLGSREPIAAVGASIWVDRLDDTSREGAIR